MKHWTNHRVICYMLISLQFVCYMESKRILFPRYWHTLCVRFSSVQSLSRVRLFATPWTASRQASLSITNTQSLPKLMSIESEMPSNHLILCHPLLLLPSIFPSTRVFANKSALCIRWPKYWSFSFNISPSKEHPGRSSFCYSHEFWETNSLRRTMQIVESSLLRWWAQGRVSS